MNRAVLTNTFMCYFMWLFSNQKSAQSYCQFHHHLAETFLLEIFILDWSKRPIIMQILMALVLLQNPCAILCHWKKGPLLSHLQLLLNCVQLLAFFLIRKLPMNLLEEWCCLDSVFDTREILCWASWQACVLLANPKRVFPWPWRSCSANQSHCFR